MKNEVLTKVVILSLEFFISSFLDLIVFPFLGLLFNH